MAYKSNAHILPRPPLADWRPPVEQAAWELHKRLAKQAEDEREALRAAERKRHQANVANDIAAADNATADKNAAPARNGVSAHFD